jgi:hypothetical protein
LDESLLLRFSGPVALVVEIALQAIRPNRKAIQRRLNSRRRFAEAA